MNKWFYSNISYIGDEILVKGYDLNGTPIKGKTQYTPYVFIKGAGQYKIFNSDTRLVKKEFDNFELLKKYSKHNICYGIGCGNGYVKKKEFIYNWITDNFEDDEIEYNNKFIKILSWDIETTSENWPDYKNPVESILSIATSVTNNGERIYKTFGIKECTDENVLNYEHCNDELDLIEKFCKYVRESDIDVITGWYSDRFDITYFCARVEYQYDANILKLLSPFNIQPTRVHKKTKNRKTGQDEEYDTYVIEGISILDMMKLYAKFDTYNGSLSLNNIAKRELGESKTDYSEYGSLKNLYKNDWNKFIFYNQQDVMLVDKIADKTKFIELAISMAYLGKIRYEDAYSPIITIDMLIHNTLHKRKEVVPLKVENVKDHQNRGGKVKDSKTGFSDYVVTTDSTSHYPSIFISLNVSPETFIKKIDVNEDKILSMGYNTSWLKEANCSLASNGCIFDNKKQGVVSGIVENLFKKRKEYKDLMKLEKGKTNPDYGLVKKYDVYQYTYKILINSIYGVFGSVNFRYYSLDIAEAITVTGQTLISLADVSINAYLNDYLHNKKIRDYVVFSDTDSCGIELKDVINKIKPENPIDFLNNFYESELDPAINKSFEKFSSFCNFYRNNISFKREKIIEKMIITGKKRYACLVYDDEGFRYDAPKTVIKGLEVVRSNTPDIIREKLNEAVDIILKGTEKDIQKFVEEFRKEFIKLPLEQIAQPTGVYGIDKYKNDDNVFNKGTSSHIKAALIYNNFIEKNGLDKEYEYIKDGDKIKVISIKIPNPTMNDRFAVKNSFDKIFGIHKYIDYNKQYESTFLIPLKRLLTVINWEAEESTSFNI